MRPLVVNLHPEFAHTTHNDKALARNGGCYWVSWFEKSKTDPAAAGTIRRHNPRFPALRSDSTALSWASRRKQTPPSQPNS